MKCLIFLPVIAAACAALLSCNPTAGNPERLVAVPVDSFVLYGADVTQQTGALKYIDDHTLVSYDLTNMNLVFFRKDQHGDYRAERKKPIDTEFWSMHFTDDRGNHYFTDRSNTITVYDPEADSLTARYTIPHRFRYLKDSFALSVANSSPVLVRHDTLVAVISPNSNEAVSSYYREQEISEFRILPGSDTLQYLRSYINKPSNLSDYDFPMGMYAFHNNTVFLMYPQYDTIYRFHRSGTAVSKTPVANPDFVQPARFACEPFTPGYGSCATKYYLHNFRYYGIHFNTLTKHFLLFYVAPVKQVKGRIPSPKDQALQVMVLDEQLRPLRRYTFNKNLEAGSSFLMMPGKGLAMPVLSEHYEKTRFYIYNL